MMELINTLWDGTRVYVVDGNEVRNKYSTEFTEGGHNFVYDYIPKDTIWLEQLESQADMQANLMHEIYEYTLMKYEGHDYNKAHEKAANVEAVIRQVQGTKTEGVHPMKRLQEVIKKSESTFPDVLDPDTEDALITIASNERAYYDKKDAKGAIQFAVKEYLKDTLETLKGDLETATPSLIKKLQKYWADK